jgi:hypothetical protein
MKLSIQVASTSQTVNVFVQDSSSTTGAGLTGLAFNSAGLTAYYALPKAAAVAITLATLAAVTTAWSSGGFKEIDATNMPGWYRLDIPDAALASGRFVSIHLKGATNMAPLPLEIELTGWNNQDAVRGGLTALPNANAEAAGGLYTRGSGAGQIAQQANGQIDVNLSTVKTQAVTCAAGVTVLASVGTAATSTAQTGDSYARLGAPAGASVSADVASVKTDSSGLRTDYTTARAGYLDVLNGIVQAIWDKATSALTTVGSIGKLLVTDIDAAISSRSTYAGADTAGTTTLLARVPGTVQPQTGDSYARLGAPAGASVSADIAAVKADTAAGATASALSTVATSIAAIPTATQNADALLKRDMSAVSGEAARSPLNAFRFLRNKWSVALGTLTVTKEDDTTAAWTGTVSTDAAAVPITGNDPA